MTYTTTKCPHCGFKLRNRETGVSRVELGQSLISCPMCGGAVVDSIYVEYEFMTEWERKFYTGKGVVLQRIFIGLFFMLLGLLSFLCLILGSSNNGEGMSLLIIVGLAFIIIGIVCFCTAKDIKNKHLFEQAIYESLIRTSNKKYVEFLVNVYKDDREYSKVENREEIIKEYKNYLTDEFHSVHKSSFDKISKFINNNEDKKETKKSKNSSIRM